MADTPHIVCPHCGTVNRVPADRPAAAARCGRCHRLLFEAHPVEVDEAGFETACEGERHPGAGRHLGTVVRPVSGDGTTVRTRSRGSGAANAGCSSLTLTPRPKPAPGSTCAEFPRCSFCTKVRSSERRRVRWTPMPSCAGRPISLQRHRFDEGRNMSIDQAVLGFAGVMVLLSALLVWLVSPWWLLLVAFVRANLVQASITGFCPAAKVFKLIGLKPGYAFK